MKLTETQKNFLKEMREIEKSDPDSLINMKRKNLVWIISSIGVLFLLVSVLTGLMMKINSKDELSPGIPLVPSVEAMLEASVSSAPVLTKVMPERNAEFINDLELYESELKIISQKISIFHKQPMEQRNIEQYRSKLIEGIEICDNYLEYLKGLKPVNEFQNSWFAKYEDINIKNLKTAYKYYLDYLHSKRNSDIDMANNFITLSNEHNFLNQLIDYLNQKNYKYEILDDGAVKYWYSK